MNRKNQSVWMLIALVGVGSITACHGARVKVTYQCPDALEGNEDSHGLGPAHTLLRGFADSIGEYDFLRQASVGNDVPDIDVRDDSTQYFDDIVRAMLMPRKALLHQQALWYFHKLPAGEKRNTDGWFSMDTPLSALREAMNVHTGGVGANNDREARTFIQNWDMQTLFFRIRMALVLRYRTSYSSASFGDFIGWTHYRMIRLNSNGDHPVLVIQSANEYFALTLRYDPIRGIYEPEQLEWLVKSVPADMPGATDEEPQTDTPPIDRSEAVESPAHPDEE